MRAQRQRALSMAIIHCGLEVCCACERRRSFRKPAWHHQFQRL